MGGQVTPAWCEDHRSSYLGDCPFCLAGLEPTRFLEARRDFGGLPLPGTRDILPHYDVVSLEDVLGVLGQQLAELELQEAEAIRPYAVAKQVIYRQMRKAHISPRILQQAVRIHLGIQGASNHQADPAVAAVVAILARSR
jgi:hypothetical protein